MTSSIEQLIPKIGLEVHVQLSTQSKLLSSDPNRFGGSPNEYTSPVTMAHPGSLPVPNKKAVEFAIKLGLALGCELSETLSFDRKNYFYPDLPKGYQITQDANPICTGGKLSVFNEDIHLIKIHLEEDAGKSIHDEEGNTLVDLNRAGVPLLEIVTEPELSSSKQAAQFLTEVRKLVRYLEISDGNMEEGSLRCDANISLHIPGEPLGNKVEIKNMNSFRHVARAIDNEIERQKNELANGRNIVSETRSYQPDRKETFRMRTKEELNDYRYFPEPDISETKLNKLWIDSIRQQLPALPWEVKSRLTDEFKVKDHDAIILAEDRNMSDYFFDSSKNVKDFQSLANLMVGPFKSWINEQKKEVIDVKCKPNAFGELVRLIENKKISHTAAQKILPYLLSGAYDNPWQAAKEMDLVQERNVSELNPVIEEVLDSLPDKVKEYNNGKKGLIGLFMGQIMKKTKGSADPKLTNKLLTEALNKRKV